MIIFKLPPFVVPEIFLLQQCKDLVRHPVTQRSLVWADRYVGTTIIDCTGNDFSYVLKFIIDVIAVYITKVTDENVTPL